MATEKPAKILRAKSEFSEEQINAMSDGEAWAWIYAQKPKAKEKLDQICFTGFSPSICNDLEAQAKSVHLKVVTSVTKNLRYLCTGPNAGPAKLKRATEQDVILMTLEQFENMMNTGELPG